MRIDEDPSPPNDSSDGHMPGHTLRTRSQNLHAFNRSIVCRLNASHTTNISNSVDLFVYVSASTMCCNIVLRNSMAKLMPNPRRIDDFNELPLMSTNP